MKGIAMISEKVLRLLKRYAWKRNLEFKSEPLVTIMQIKGHYWN
jgi:hypothetical protein